MKSSVLFVCMGNICRSPAGEGILKEMVKHKPSLSIHVESCGIGGWHVGQQPDRRMQEAISGRGIELTMRAQQMQRGYFERFDYILAADEEVLNYLHQMADKPEYKSKVSLITAYSLAYKGKEVPDPYYGGQNSFELVLDMLEDACRGLLEHIEKS